jgi:hypothetical protein
MKMILSAEILKLVIQYQNDKFGTSFTEKDYKLKPWHEIVDLSWDALIYYGKDNWYSDLNNVKQPEEGMHVWIKKGTQVQGYRAENGEWIKTGDMDSSIYKE